MDDKIYVLILITFKISTLVSVGINLVPFITLVILNFFIYKTLKKKGKLLPWTATRAKREHFIATILIIIVLVFAICHSFKSFINIIELCQVVSGRQLWGEKMNVLVAISHLCITFNSSINFAIYCSKDRNFRRQFLKRLTCGLVEKFKIHSISHRRRVSFRSRNQVKDLGANSKSEHIGIKVILTNEHRPVTRVCRSRSVQQAQDPKEEITTAV